MVEFSLLSLPTTLPYTLTVYVWRKGGGKQQILSWDSLIKINVEVRDDFTFKRVLFLIISIRDNGNSYVLTSFPFLLKPLTILVHHSITMSVRFKSPSWKIETFFPSKPSGLGFSPYGIKDTFQNLHSKTRLYHIRVVLIPKRFLDTTTLY